MTRPRSRLRRFERWFVGLLMAVLVFVLELVMHQIRRRSRASDDAGPP